MGGGQSFPKIFTYVLPPSHGGDLTLLRTKLAKANAKLKHKVGDFPNKGETPAFWAAAYGQVAALRILIASGADLSVVPPAGHTITMNARQGSGQR
ncbi:hypothetical protein T484DRAFT_1759993 [Baffinella frigidus]|nr:hypothetical protein T484DRAFT_1759993 [Cryptophyta sp. CCMP2293]